MKFRPTRNLKIILEDGRTRYTFPNASFALLDDGKDEADTVDRIATLSLYHDPAFVAKYELEILNDGAIYDAELKDLFNSPRFYDHMKFYEDALKNWEEN